MNNVAVKICHQFLCRLMFSFLLSAYLETEWLDPVVTMFDILRNSKLLFQASAPFYNFTFTAPLRNVQKISIPEQSGQWEE